MVPIQLRTVRPFVLDSIALNDEEDLDLSDQLEISKLLKDKVPSSFYIQWAHPLTR